MLHVRDLMTRHVVTIDMDSSLEDIRQIFEAAPFHHIIVTEERRVVGVVSDRDLLKHLSPFLGTLSERKQDLNVLRKRVHQMMTRALLTTRPDSLVGEAGRRMLEHRVSCLPVVNEHGECEGILTVRDIARWSLEQIDEHDRRTTAA